MKISIIGAGNVGSQTAMRLAEAGLGDILLVDIVKGLAQGKALDLEDAMPILKYNYNIEGAEDIKKIGGSDIIIITAGLARRPGMTREDLFKKNAQILKELAQNLKKISPEAILIVVTNPLDLMTRLVLEITGFNPAKVFGMGITLDAARFANLIGKELHIPGTDIDVSLIGVHGEGMQPLPRFSQIKGEGIDEFLNKIKVEELIKKTLGRGAEIVSLLGSGSAFFAPSAAIAAIVKTIVGDEKRTLGVSAYLNGEYGTKGVCIGVPCRLGKRGIEEIIELDLNKEEERLFLKSAANLKEQYEKLTI